MLASLPSLASLNDFLWLLGQKAQFLAWSVKPCLLWTCDPACLPLLHALLCLWRPSLTGIVLSVSLSLCMQALQVQTFALAQFSYWNILLPPYLLGLVSAPFCSLSVSTDLALLVEELC